MLIDAHLYHQAKHQSYFLSINYISLQLSEDVIQMKKVATLQRQELIEQLVEDLELQANNTTPAQVISVGGKVRFPGRYPLESSMNVSDLIQAAGGPEESAYTLEAELTRRKINSDRYRSTSYRLFSLQGIEQELKDDFDLLPHDHVNVRRLPQWNEKQTITLEGEVRFPGEYPITQGETLAQILKRAGGLTEYAFPEGALFSRQALREKEHNENEAMISRLEREMASLTIEKLNSDPTKRSSVDYVAQLLEKMRDVEPLGRLSINLPLIVKTDSSDNDVHGLEVKSGDKLVIPQNPVSVTTVGELFYPSSHMFQPNMSAEEYVKLSGGFTQNADKEHYYIVHANGQVEPGAQGVWFRTVSGSTVQAGDTIVVPLDADRMEPLTLFTNIADIAAKIAMATANLIAIGSM